LVENDDLCTKEYVFTYSQFVQKGLKEPLIFSPIKWIFEVEKKHAYIKTKTNVQAIWKRYRDRHNRPEYQAYFLMLERLFFHTPGGLENYSLSHTFYLPFLFHLTAGIKENDIINGVDWLFMPMNIPVNTYYKCLKNSNEEIILDSWITLDKERLDELLTKEKFRNKAKDYHFSQDFTISSDIKIIFKNFTLHSVNFRVEIKNNNGLYEMFQFTIERDNFDIISSEDPNTKYIVGKPGIIDPY